MSPQGLFDEDERSLRNRLSPSRQAARSLFLNHFAALRVARRTLWDLRESYFWNYSEASISSFCLPEINRIFFCLGSIVRRSIHHLFGGFDFSFRMFNPYAMLNTIDRPARNPMTNEIMSLFFANWLRRILIARANCPIIR